MPARGSALSLFSPTPPLTRLLFGPIFSHPRTSPPPQARNPALARLFEKRLRPASMRPEGDSFDVSAAQDPSFVSSIMNEQMLPPADEAAFQEEEEQECLIDNTTYNEPEFGNGDDDRLPAQPDADEDNTVPTAEQVGDCDWSCPAACECGVFFVDTAVC